MRAQTHRPRSRACSFSPITKLSLLLSLALPMLLACGGARGAAQPAAAAEAKGALPAASAPRKATTNLIRNGSFEGSGRYWYGATEAMLDKERSAFGRYSIKLASDRTPEDQRKRGFRPRTNSEIRAGSFLLERDREVTVSFSIYAEEPQEVLVWLFPSNRQTAQGYKLVWDHDNAHRFEAGPEWKRVHFKIKHNIFPDKWFQNHVFSLSIRAENTWVDGVSVSYTEGLEQYEARSPVEVAADIGGMPGYLSESANLNQLGDTVSVRGAVHNAGDRVEDVKVVWQFYDYSGTRTLGEAVTKSFRLAPGGTESATVPLKVSEKGLTLARVSAYDGAGSLLDKSDFPVTVVAHPKSATTLDPSERIGIGVRGPHTLKLAQLLGFRWTRWYPTGSWEDVQPKGPKEWNWPDKQLEEVEQHGIIPVLVLHRVPGWARPKGNNHNEAIPADMPWGLNDPRWDDLAIKTNYDRFIEAAAQRYKEKPYAWELSNEPDLSHAISPDLQYLMAKRTSRLIKRIKPEATFLVNSTLGRQTNYFHRFFELGGSQVIDGWSWHDYHPTSIGDAGKIRRMRQMIDTYGGKDVQIWFDEGFSHITSATDYAAPEVTPSTSAEAANWMTANWVDMFAAGLEKLIVFYIGYEHQGRSFWDNYGAGTELWDATELPTVGVSMYNTMIHHLGKSRPASSFEVGEVSVRAFEDERNGRGVLVVWSKTPASLGLAVSNVRLEDVTGNEQVLPAQDGITKVELRGEGQPLYVFTSDNKSAAKLVEAVKRSQP
jgi:hypothetical protein